MCARSTSPKLPHTTSADKSRQPHKQAHPRHARSLFLYACAAPLRSRDGETQPEKPRNMCMDTLGCSSLPYARAVERLFVPDQFWMQLRGHPDRFRCLLVRLRRCTSPQGKTRGCHRLSAHMPRKANGQGRQTCIPNEAMMKRAGSGRERGLKTTAMANLMSTEEIKPWMATIKLVHFIQ